MFSKINLTQVKMKDFAIAKMSSKAQMVIPAEIMRPVFYE